MADKIFQTRAYLSYWLDAVDEHSLHSPFFFDLYTKVIKPKAAFQGIESIEKLRHQLLKNKRSVSLQDLGSRASDGPRKIAEIAYSALSPLKYSGIYLRLIEHFKAKNVVELGTSFGINTLYLAQQQDSRVYTFEGSKEVADVAQLTFEFSQRNNIELVFGNIDATLSETLQRVRKIDFALMDANHRYAPTIRYFNKIVSRLTERSVVVMDDIHYSAEMEKAWDEIRHNNLVYGSADLFRCGLLFFDPSLNKQHVILQL